ncbi:MAG: hypothetical protein UT24_C0034G0020 [Candidatus Woesebacteria bacterium GW2011_GWB1_39_12]|uniref:Uncharacterized protein n=1 Tax=Candidatus Woesebacteria bacterium GW2011_GWB1_39_12 TaxID=1618574 RepID=A0A0G0M6J0_9BACT|nr:MAG: hypothetical protein UT24_C0034G0020 [Candidatus Woesebacteria bacterium GW2011_GWB1_39_12]
MKGDIVYSFCNFCGKVTKHIRGVKLERIRGLRQEIPILHCLNCENEKEAENE